MRITLAVLTFVVLAFTMGSAGAAVVALVCHGPFYADGTVVGSDCHATAICLDGEKPVVHSVTVDGTTCRVKYSCCKDPVRP